jgi:DnaJ family protein C protein 17
LIVLSTTLKEKTGGKPPKTASALVPFKRIGDAFAAVCASEKKDMGMTGVKISWAKGEEPAILGWLRKMGKLSNASSTNAVAKDFSSSLPPQSLQSGGQETAELPQNQTGNSSNPFSSFPSTLVCPPLLKDLV